MFVGRDGRVLHSELERPSGNPALDRFTLGLVPRLTFRGATVDGVPADVWVQLPINLQ
jgi:TonB family protein